MKMLPLCEKVQTLINIKICSELNIKICRSILHLYLCIIHTSASREKFILQNFIHKNITDNRTDKTI